MKKSSNDLLYFCHQMRWKIHNSCIGVEFGLFCHQLVNWSSYMGPVNRNPYLGSISWIPYLDGQLKSWPGQSTESPHLRSFPGICQLKLLTGWSTEVITWGQLKPSPGWSIEALTWGRSTKALTRGLSTKALTWGRSIETLIWGQLMP